MTTNDNFTRRTFVKTSIAASSAALLPAQSPNDTVRVAFIGVGNRGSYLLKSMLDVPGIKVVAICDIDPENLKKAVDAATAAGHTPDTYADFRKMLDRKDIDAVVIATPVDLHKEMAIASLEVGKHVYCEKPMGLTPEQCRMVVNAAKSAKGIFQAGFQLRHDPNRAASDETSSTMAASARFCSSRATATPAICPVRRCGISTVRGPATISSNRPAISST